MAIVFLQYSYVCTNGPIPFCIPEGILTQIFTYVNVGYLNKVEHNHPKGVARNISVGD
jgi:hypothetical protein